MNDNVVTPTAELLHSQIETNWYKVYGENTIPPPRFWCMSAKFDHDNPNVSLLNAVGTGPKRLAVMYSGGLESAMMATTVVPAGTHFIFCPDAKGIAKGKGLKRTEPVLISLAALLDFPCVMLGLEYGPENESVGDNSVYSLFEMNRASSSINVIQPLQGFGKYSIFKAATMLNLSYNSCDNDWNWCGRCFKCFQIKTFQLMLDEVNKNMAVDRYSPKIEVNDQDMVDYFIQELRDYFKTGNSDPLSDNWSFVDMLRNEGRSLKVDHIENLWFCYMNRG